MNTFQDFADDMDDEADSDYESYDRADYEAEDEDDAYWAEDELLGRKVQSEEDFKHDSRFPPGTVLYLVAWEGYGDEENSWEKRENISNNLIRDYYERQILESEAADAEGEPEDDDGDDERNEQAGNLSEAEIHHDRQSNEA